MVAPKAPGRPEGGSMLDELVQVLPPSVVMSTDTGAPPVPGPLPNIETQQCSASRHQIDVRPPPGGALTLLHLLPPSVVVRASSPPTARQCSTSGQEIDMSVNPEASLPKDFHFLPPLVVPSRSGGRRWDNASDDRGPIETRRGRHACRRLYGRRLGPGAHHRPQLAFGLQLFYPLPSRGIINLPPIVCHQQVEWGSLLLGVAGGALLGGLLAVVIMAIARIRNPV